MIERLTPKHGLAKLQETSGEFTELFHHGTLVVEIYQPRNIDQQKPHSRDEIYVVISGSGWFVNAESRERFEPGEVLFVPAGVLHRFEDFTDDFATWVFFYGPDGGEVEART